MSFNSRFTKVLNPRNTFHTNSQKFINNFKKDMKDSSPTWLDVTVEIHTDPGGIS